MVKKAAPKKTVIDRACSLNYMNPFSNEYPPADPDSYGKFVTLNSVSRFEIQTSTTKDRIFVWCPSIQGIYQYLVIDDDGTATAADLVKSPTRKFYTEPPSSSRTLRAGLKLRNLTSNNDTGGIVHVLNSVLLLKPKVCGVLLLVLLLLVPLWRHLPKNLFPWLLVVKVVNLILLSRGMLVLLGGTLTTPGSMLITLRGMLIPLGGMLIPLGGGCSSP